MSKTYEALFSPEFPETPFLCELRAKVIRAIQRRNYEAARLRIRAIQHTLELLPERPNALIGRIADVRRRITNHLMRQEARYVS